MSGSLRRVLSKIPARSSFIDGYMVDKMGKNAEHGYATKQALKALEARLPDGWTWRKKEPVRISAYDEPEPDVAIVRGSDADYEHRIPTPPMWALGRGVWLDAGQDRAKKCTAYAMAGIPVYWIVNLVNRQVEVYSRPGKTGYQVAPQGLSPGPASPGDDRRSETPRDRSR